ncbi:class I SAM-dependent methyltransferase [Methylorubrum populi]|uniref:class I SAM-dependent methyltransferase n=1 Tax=Methylorubrum populi TaxID=223967 RepID=UPI00126481FF|nr:class I SAM-dependent methyltransferase [Methylorubrum populi]
MGIYDIFLSNSGPAVHMQAQCCAAYERHLARYVNTPMTLLQLGIREGGALQMWKKWLGPNARIVGIDGDPGCARHADEQIIVRTGNGSEAKFLREVVAELGSIDVVIDDGSHQMIDMIASFDFLYERISPNGVYLIQAAHTAYLPSYGGGLNESGTIIQRFKDLLDELHANHVHNNALRPTSFTKSTLSMTAYESILVFEKAIAPNRHFIRTGGY